MKRQIEIIYEEFNDKRKKIDSQLADEQDLEELKKIGRKNKKREMIILF